VLKGQADVGAVSEYALAEPYIKADEVKQLRVLYSIPGVPAHGISIDDDVNPQLRTKIINALLKLNEPQNNKLLKDLTNATKLVKVDHDQHLALMRKALATAKID
jgi:phosphonate transport system substrate-binding protein